MFGNLSSLLGDMGNNQNLLSLILGIKNGSSPFDAISSIMGKNSNNPLSQVMSALKDDKNKKESASSPQTFPKDDMVN